MNAGEIVIAIVAGIVAGAYAGLLGVGGGIVMVPAMVLLLDQPQRIAEGTSLLAIVGTSFIASRAHHSNHLILPRWAGLLAVGGVGGAAIGSLIAVSLIEDEEVLRAIFGVFLLVIAAWIVLRRPGERDADA